MTKYETTQEIPYSEYAELHIVHSEHTKCKSVNFLCYFPTYTCTYWSITYLPGKMSVHVNGGSMPVHLVWPHQPKCPIKIMSHEANRGRWWIFTKVAEGIRGIWDELDPPAVQSIHSSHSWAVNGLNSRVGGCRCGWGSWYYISSARNRGKVR